MIGTLLSKDWRVNRVATIGGVVMVASAYGLIWAVSVLQSNPPRVVSFPQSCIAIAAIAGRLGLILTAVIAAIHGAAAFTLERRERSADFVSMLPIGRGEIVLSKILTAIVCPIALWLVN